MAINADDTLAMTTPDLSKPSEANTADVPLQQRIDDEPMRLITSFNDVFVFVASLLLLLGTAWLTVSLPRWLATLIGAAMFWGLSEIFVRRRRMALPALYYAFGFLATCATSGFSVLHSVNDLDEFSAVAEQPVSGIVLPMIASYVVLAIGTVLYWKRFRVPVTFAMGIGGAVTMTWIVFVLLLNEPFIGALRAANIALGLAIFGWALRWDARDPKRTTIRSDVAFWLHLLAACMVTHPIFWALMPAYPFAAIAVFVLLTGISLIIDRRALMMSSLLYVISAIVNVLMTSTGTQSLAVVAVVVGGGLLLLSVFWQPARHAVLKLVPADLRERLPQ